MSDKLRSSDFPIMTEAIFENGVGGITLVYGPPKSGTSLLAMNLVRALHEGGRDWIWFQLCDRRRDWVVRLLSMLEKSWRVDENMNDLARVWDYRREQVEEYALAVIDKFVATMQQDGHLLTSKDFLAWVRNYAVSGRVIFIDNFSHIALDKDEDRLSFMVSLKRLAEASGAAIVLLAHTEDGAAQAKDPFWVENVQSDSILSQHCRQAFCIEDIEYEVKSREITVVGGAKMRVLYNMAVVLGAPTSQKIQRMRILLKRDLNSPCMSELAAIGMV